MSGQWRRTVTPPEMRAAARAGGEPGLRCWERDAGDGTLRVMVAQAVSADWDAPRWHLSISHQTRLPTWDEVKEARYRFLPGGITAAMLLPPAGEYVNVHEFCFHLWEMPAPQRRPSPLDAMAAYQDGLNIRRAARGASLRAARKAAGR